MLNQRLAPDPGAPASSDTATIRIESKDNSPQKSFSDEPVRLAVSPVTISPVKTPPPPPSVPKGSLTPANSQQPAPPIPRIPPPIDTIGDGSGSNIGKSAVFMIVNDGDNFELSVFRPHRKSIMKRTAKVIEGLDGELEIVPEDPPPSPRPQARKRVGFPDKLITGELEPADDDDSVDAKSEWGGQSVDLRGKEIWDKSVECGEPMDPATTRAAWKDRQRLRGSANGRSFQEKAEKTEASIEMSPQEKAFTEETAVRGCYL